VLYATDIDSDDEMLIFIITQPVHRGILYMSSSNNGSEQNISLFTPVDLREGGFCSISLVGYSLVVLVLIALGSLPVLIADIS